MPPIVPALLVRHARFRPVRWAANRPASTVQVDFEAEAGLLGFSGQGQLRIFGPSNEKYAIRGGCDQLPTRLSAQLQGQIELGQQLVAVRQGGGTVTLDKVVLAVPFSILRSSVDFSGAGFRPLKQTAIRELGMGTNSKLHVQFTDRHWEGLGCNGETFADTGYQNTWDESRAQGGRSGILVNYTGGSVGAGFGSGSPTSRAKQLLAQLEPLLPGITAKWNGRATIDFWLGNPWSNSPASTPRSTPRATSTAQSRPASEPPRNCSRPNLSATLPCPAPGRRDRRRGDVHRAANAAACLSTAL